MVKALIFDLDETVYDEIQYRLSGMSAICHWLEEQGLIDKAKRAEEIVLYLTRRDGWRSGHLLQDMLTRLGLEEDLTSILLKVYREHAPTLTLYKDFIAFMRDFRSDFKLGIITEGLREIQEAKVRALGLHQWFAPEHVVITGALSGEPTKLEPRPFVEAEARLACPGQDCLYVGDNPERDFRQPRALGWLTVRLRRGQYADLPDRGEAHWMIDSFDELPSLPPLSKMEPSHARPN